MYRILIALAYMMQQLKNILLDNSSTICLPESALCSRRELYTKSLLNQNIKDGPKSKLDKFSGF